MRRIVKSKLSILLIAAVFFNYTGFSYAADFPTGAQAVSGTLSTSVDGNTMTENVSDNAIIQYYGFDVGADKTLNIMHDTAGAASLHRVVGPDASSIYGRLNSNGKVFLINPNGVLFAPGSHVDAAGLVASTMGMSNEDFLAGRYVFNRNGATGSVVNEGDIKISNGGYIALLAPEVRNTGAIEAKLGTVVLASGNKATLSLDDNGDISVVVDEALSESLTGQTTGVKNTGTINADGGKVILTAKALNGVLDRAINNEGVVQANNLVEKDGSIELVADGGAIQNSGTIQATGSVRVSNPNGDVNNSGTISANGANGGIVDVVAKNITNFGKITANAFEGGAAGLVNLVAASFTVLKAGSSVEAKATGLNGKGGSVTVKSNDTTIVEEGAVIDVSGGLASGDAGSVEVSANNELGFYGDIYGSAADGYKKGSVLFDPNNIIINDSFDATIFGTQFIKASSIQFMSNFGITLTFTATNDIDMLVNLLGLNSAIAFFAGHNISLGTLLGGGVVVSSNGHLVAFVADSDNNGNGRFSMAAGSQILSNGGDIDIISAQSVQVREINAGSGNVSITAKNSNANIIADSDSSTRVRGKTATLIAGNNIGASGAGIATSVDILKALANNGSVNARNNKSFFTDTIANNDVNLTAETGSILVDFIKAGDSVTLQADDSIIGLYNHSLDVDTKNLYAYTNNGAINGNYYFPAPDNSGVGFLTTNAGYVDAEAANGVAIADIGSFELYATSSNYGVLAVAGGDMTVDYISAPLVGLAAGGSIGSASNAANLSTDDAYLFASDIYAKNDKSMFLTADATNTLDVKTTAGDLKLKTVAANTATLTAANAITDANGSANNITATNLTMNAAAGIGSGDALETKVSNLKVTNTDSGDIQVSNDGGLVLTNFGTGNAVTNNGGSVDISAHSPLTVNSAVVASGNITLTAANEAHSADNLTVNADITSTGNGLIDLNAGDNFVQNSGTISTGADVDVSAGNNATFKGNVTAENIVVNAGNSILQTTGALVANTLTATARGIIDLFSSSNDVNSFSAHSTLLGSIRYQDLNDVTLQDVTTNFGSITVKAGGSLLANEVTAGGLFSNVYLTANDDVSLGSVTASGDDVFVTSKYGSIIGLFSDDVNVRARNLYLSAEEGSIYGYNSPEWLYYSNNGERDFLKTDVDNVTAKADDRINLYNIDSVTLKDVETSAGSEESIMVVADGNINVDYVYDPYDVTLEAHDGSIIGNYRHHNANIETEDLYLYATDSIYGKTKEDSYYGNNTNGFLVTNVNYLEAVTDVPTPSPSPTPEVLESFHKSETKGVIDIYNKKTIELGFVTAGSEATIVANGDVNVDYVTAPSVTLEAQDGSIIGSGWNYADIDAGSAYLYASDSIYGNSGYGFYFEGNKDNEYGFLNTYVDYLEAVTGEVATPSPEAFSTESSSTGVINIYNDKSVELGNVSAGSEATILADGNINVDYVSAPTVTLEAWDGSIIGSGTGWVDVDAINTYLYATDSIYGNTLVDTYYGHKIHDFLSTDTHYLEAVVGNSMDIFANDNGGVEVNAQAFGTTSINLVSVGDMFVDYVSDPLDVTLESQNGSIIGSGIKPVDVDTVNLSLHAAKDIMGNTLLDRYFSGDTVKALFTNADHLEVNAGGNSLVLDNGATTLGNSFVGGDFVFENTTGDINFAGTTHAEGVVQIVAEHGDMNGISAGPSGYHVEANSSEFASFLGTPDGVMGLFPYNPINVNIPNAPLFIDIGKAHGFDAGLLTGFVNNPNPLNGNPTVPNTASLLKMVYPSPLYPPGNIFFNTTKIWPPVSSNFLSLMSAGLTSKFLFPHAERLAGTQINVMDLPSSAAFKLSSPVYFYHPLSLVDNGSYDGMNLEEGAYDYIDGQINACQPDAKGANPCKKGNS
ncbi:MAG: filamentous hemagglutinin N-terminal domain-containing protein [Candidatus Omnitrophica bacterium]|nr:filamentous hemagglutinin N-terminal domain-containing protein [Candidatus Omnitrophota bacterium]